VIPPDLKELLSYTKFQIKAEMNCISLGTIQSFDSKTQTATIKMNFKRVLKAAIPPTTTGSLAKNKVVEYPLLVKCPVFVLSGGDSAVHMPIEAGDQCIILFCDRDIDSWFTTGETMRPNSPRMHDINDGIALVGIKPAPSPISELRTSGPALVKTGLTGLKSIIAADEKLLLSVGEQTLKDLFGGFIGQVVSTYQHIQSFYTVMYNLKVETGAALDNPTKTLVLTEINDIITAINDFTQIQADVNKLFM
jgi:hypothetical protein